MFKRKQKTAGQKKLEEGTGPDLDHIKSEDSSVLQAYEAAKTAKLTNFKKRKAEDFLEKYDKGGLH